MRATTPIDSDAYFTLYRDARGPLDEPALFRPQSQMDVEERVRACKAGDRDACSQRKHAPADDPAMKSAE